ncbi:MAG: nucleotidyl transferase AbiEii/AbiGii toxin family protein [Sandaracinobacter sp.]
MIDRRDILDMASQMSLTPHVVEKDYVLGWMLAGIASHPILRETWVFKGGTCLKKCYFETYRFSEDLDFTLTDPDQINEEFLKTAFAEIGGWIYEQTGIEVPPEKQKFDIYKNPRGTISCEGKIKYRGPVSPRDMPGIKLDLTADERLVLPPVRVPVFHPYTDTPEQGIDVLSYAYEEVFGEKIRALGERTRPRDLYDVVNLFRNDDARPSSSVLLDVLRQKCEFKGINVPTLADLEPHRQELMGLWDNMLAHQLPVLPPYESFWDELPSFFDGINGGATPAIPVAYANDGSETVLRARNLRLPVSGAAQTMIEIVRFAAANRLCVDLEYKKLDGSTSRPRIEAYSLRRTADGNILLHGHDVNQNGPRSYRIERIQSARVTNQTFVPKYEIELTPKGPVSVAPSPARATSSAFRAQPVTRARAAPRKKASSSYFAKPTHTYQCPMCSKKFKREKYDAKLNPHKNQWGQPCSGRTGFLVS